MISSVELAPTKLISIMVRQGFVLDVEIGAWLWGILGFGALALIFLRYARGGRSWTKFDIEQAEIGIGSGKVTFKPNLTDRQVAYSIWVELSTRKIGLPIDFEHDVVSEVFDSWYEFFGVTRELVKTIPVQRVREDSTQKIIQLSISVLNLGLRPLLTKWQARFRRWYEHELNSGVMLTTAPQDIQQNFPDWEELKSEMTKVNKHLISYREKMRTLVMKE